MQIVLHHFTKDAGGLSGSVSSALAKVPDLDSEGFIDLHAICGQNDSQFITLEVCCCLDAVYSSCLRAFLTVFPRHMPVMHSTDNHSYKASMNSACAPLICWTATSPVALMCQQALVSCI